MIVPNGVPRPPALRLRTLFEIYEIATEFYIVTVKSIAFKLQTHSHSEPHHKGGAPKMCITVVRAQCFHTSLKRELLGSNGKTHRIWNGGLPPDRLPMSFSFRPP